MGKHDEVAGSGEFVVKSPDAQSVAYETPEAAKAVADNVKGSKVVRRGNDGSGAVRPPAADERLSRRRHGRSDDK